MKIQLFIILILAGLSTTAYSYKSENNSHLGIATKHQSIQGFSCSDNSDCMLDELCGGGSCIHKGDSPGFSCSDNSDCMLDEFCGDGSCIHKGDTPGFSCSDNSDCMLDEFCGGGSCISHP